MTKTTAHWIIAAVLVIAGIPVQSEPLPKIALVPGGDPKPNELLILTEAKLFELKEIELLERTEINKVLAEQKVSGMFGADNAVVLGQILKTDIFAVLETTSIVLFDAHTGLRFVDETLPEKLEEATQAAADAVKTAVEKRRKLAEESLVTFSVVEVRNIDFPVSRDAWCRAVAGMLERSLLHRGGAVLERSRLQHVNRERQLPGDATNKLWASMKLMSLEFTRVESAESFKITAKIDKEMFVAEGSFAAPLDAVHKLAEQLLKGNVRENNPTESVRRAEAARLANEAVFCDSFNYLDAAIDKSEAAVALDPENIHYVWLLCSLLSKRMHENTGSQNGKFAWDEVLRVYRIDAETMRRCVQDDLRCEELSHSLPDNRHSAFQRLVTLAEYVYPEYRDEYRAMERRSFDRWLNDRYRTTLNRVVDRATFRTHLLGGNIVPPGAAILGPAGHAAIYEEIIGNTLRLADKYGLAGEDRDPRRNFGNSAQPNDLYNVNALLEGFSIFVLDFQCKNLAETHPEAAATIERTLVMMEQDSRLMTQIYAWIARNRTVYVYSPGGENQRLANEYYEKIKSYLASLPKGIPFAHYTLLYYELTQTVKIWTDRIPMSENALDPDLFRTLAEILELADSRNEFAADTVAYYILRTYIAKKEIAKNKRGDKTGYWDVQAQMEPLALRQIDLGDHLNVPRYTTIGISDNSDKTWKAQTLNVGIGGEPPGIVMIEPPWKSEVNLFPGDGLAPQEASMTRFLGRGPVTGAGIPVIRDNIPIIYDNVLYCTLWNQTSGNVYLGCVNLETLEKQYVPLRHSSARESRLHHVDQHNVYFRMGSKPDDAGLLVYPHDGSEPWTLTMQEGSPGSDIRLLGTVDDKCYAVIDTDWIIRIDPNTGQWEQLSSSRAREGKTPFIDGRRVIEFDTLIDPVHERILLAAHWTNAGIWVIEKDGTFVPLNAGNATPFRLISLFDNSRKLLYICGTAGYIYDFETNTRSKWGPWGAMNHSISSDWSESGFRSGTGCVWNGYAYALKQWRRIPVDSPLEFEHLPVPAVFTNERKWAPNFCAPTSDGTNFVVGDDRELILLRFE